MKPEDEVFDDLDISNNNHNELSEITSDSEDNQQDVIQTDKKDKKKQNARERNRRYQDKYFEWTLILFHPFTKSSYTCQTQVHPSLLGHTQWWHSFLSTCFSYLCMFSSYDEVENILKWLQHTCVCYSKLGHTWEWPRIHDTWILGMTWGCRWGVPNPT